jgi:xanthine dehydrogenase molybdenum-binding subunit
MIVNRTTGAAVPFAEIMAKLNSTINPTQLTTPGASIQVLGTNSPSIVAQGEVTTGFAFGVCFAEVNVDTWTGKVTVVQLVFLEDMGQIVNLLMLENNMYSGILNGLGYALTEDFVIDKTTSQVISRSFLDYRVPSFTEVPKITLIPIENPDPRTPFGIKGGGEAPRVAPHSAIANAITNATGLRFTSIPITPKMIIEGLKVKGGAT